MHTLLRLNFNGGNTTEPVVSYISKTHNIDINILEANIKNTRGGSVGFLVVHIPHIETEFETFKRFTSATCKCGGG